MPTPDCNRLDDYLLGALPLSEAARFEAHLAGCPDCRDELRRQRQLDRLLAEAAARSAPVPGSLIRRIDAECARVRRRRAVGWACGLAATLAATSVLAWWMTRDQNSGGLDRSVVHQPAERPPHPLSVPARPAPLLDEASPTHTMATVTFNDDSPAIAVRVETESPNVSVFLVYPTVTAAATPQEPDIQWLPFTPERRTSDELAETHAPSDVGSLPDGDPDWRMLAGHVSGGSGRDWGF